MMLVLCNPGSDMQKEFTKCISLTPIAIVYDDQFKVHEVLREDAFDSLLQIAFAVPHGNDDGNLRLAHGLMELVAAIGVHL